jgi:hypothetical protein
MHSPLRSSNEAEMCNRKSDWTCNMAGSLRISSSGRRAFDRLPKALTSSDPIDAA